MMKLCCHDILIIVVMIVILTTKGNNAFVVPSQLPLSQHQHQQQQQQQQSVFSTSSHSISRLQPQLIGREIISGIHCRGKCFARAAVAASANSNAAANTSEENEDNTHDDDNHHQQQQQQNNDDNNQSDVDEEEEDPSETYHMNLKLAKLADRSSPRNSSSNRRRRGGKYDDNQQQHHPAIVAYQLLRSMKYPDTVAYNSVLKAFAKASPTMLQIPIQQQSNNNKDATVPTTTKTNTLSAAECAHNLLMEMIELYDEQTIANQKWYKCLNTKNILSHEEIQRGPPLVRVKPNVRSFSTVMDAYSRYGDYATTIELLDILTERYETYNSDSSLKPNIITFNSILTAYAKNKNGNNGNNNINNVQEAATAEEALDFMKFIMKQKYNIKPDVISYNAILHAFARSGVTNAGEKAEEILRTMPMTPNARSYTTVMDAWSRSTSISSSSSSSSSDDDNNNSISNVLTTGTSIKSLSPAARAHALLNELKELYQNSNYDEQFKPTCVSYSSVIHAYAMSKEPQKAQRAFDLLQEMRSLAAQKNNKKYNNLEPNTIVYNSVLNACATSSPLYSDASDDNDDDDDNDDSSNAKKRVNGNGASACASSSDNKLSLQEMIQTLYYQLIMNDSNDNAAKKRNNSNNNNNGDDDDDNSSEVPENMNIRNSQTTPIRSHRPYQFKLRPDHFTFGTVLKACANNIFWDDPAFGVKVFQEACRQGQVSLGVLVQLRQAVSGTVLQEILPAEAYDPRSRQFSMADIPDSWKRNVRGRERDGGGHNKNSIHARRR